MEYRTVTSPMTDLISQHLELWTTAITSKATAGRGNKTPSPAGEGRSEGNPTNTCNAKYTAYGIKKLRELILELAVRGKLVPQDPNDEPANELLKRIQTNKPKKFPELSIEEYSYILPDGWVIVRFGDIFSLEYGDNLPAEKRSNTGEYPVYGSNGIVGSHNECFVKSPCIVVGRKGSAGALNLSLTPGCCVTDVAYYCIPPNELDLNYVFKLFQTLGLDSLGKGIKPGLNRNEAYLLQVSIPPREEQHRIVAKVDELLALCDQLEQQQTDSIAAHQTLVQTLLDTLTQAADAAEFDQAWSRIDEHFNTLFNTDPSIDQLKQTLLQLAVMGKLVPQDPNDEPAGSLLLRINNELCSIENIKELPKLKRDSSTVDPKEFQFNIPSSWIWCELQDISLFANGKAHEQFVTDEPNYILINSRFVSNDGGIYKYVTERLSPLLEGDIAIVMSDVPDGRALVRCYVVDNSDRYTLNQRIGGIRTASIMSVQYLASVLDRNPYYLQYDDGKKQTNLKKIQILSCPIPLPPLNEQYRIVAKVDELMTLCDTLKARIAAAQTTQIHLADAIVEQAVA